VKQWYHTTTLYDVTGQSLP